jgi:hypothetical protein
MLPKTKIRYYIILFYLMIGIYPKEKEYNKLTLNQKAVKYYNYSVNKTFYRPYYDIFKIFKKLNYNINIITISENNQKSKIGRLINTISKIEIFNKLINIVYLNFKAVKMEAIKNR